MSEKIVFVDDDNTPIGVGTREEAWAKGIRMRVVRIVLKDENGRVLLQRRTAEKKSYPNLWTDSASGHVDDGDTYDSAAHRELREELGIDTQLVLKGTFKSDDAVDGKHISEYIAVYEGVIKSTQVLSLHESEVSDTKWYERNEIRRLIRETPEQFIPMLRELLERYYS